MASTYSNNDLELTTLLEEGITMSDNNIIDKFNSCTRSYKHKVKSLNTTKANDLLKILIEYRRVAKVLYYKQLNYFISNEGKLDLSGGGFYNNVNTFLMVVYKDIIARQVNGILKSHLSNRENDFVRIVNSSNIPDNIKKELFSINRRNDWFKKASTGTYLLARKIFKQCLKINRHPSFHNLNMKLNFKVARIEKSKTTSDNYTVRLSLGDKKFLNITLFDNTYFERVLEDLKKSKTTFQINKGMEFIFDHQTNKLIDICFTLTKNKSFKKIESIGEVISLDFGLKNLFVSNKGDYYSKDFMKVLLRYDKKIESLTYNLRRIDKNYTLTSNIRYNNLISTRRDYIDNEICRVLNRVVKRYKPSKLILENLNFKSSDMNSTMNRLISNCGRSTIAKKLETLKEDYGIIIELINPAYTSQECSVCSHTDSENRKSQDKFECTCCGHKENADFNASKVIRGRSLDGWFKTNKYATKNEIKLYLKNKNLLYIKDMKGLKDKMYVNTNTLKSVNSSRLILADKTI